MLASVRHTGIAGALLCAMLFLPQGLMAQASTTGALAGTVVDPSGAPVPDVRVTARLADTGLARSAKTDDAGQYGLPALPVGVYTLIFEKEGFSKSSVSASVSLGQVASQRVTMAVAEVVERLDVSDRSEALDAAATTAAAVLGGERVEEAPAQTRSYLNFVLVAPSVAPSSGTNTNRSLAASRNIRNDSGFVFPGLRGRNNGILIDGMDNRDETSGENRVAVGLEMIAEFRTTSANLSAEFGGAAGGVVNLVTRSGVNLWHGDATFFVQNERLNARNPEVEAGKNSFRRYQPGVSLLGPVKRDRTYFAAALEQTWESGQEWSDASARAVQMINPVLRQPGFAGAAVPSLTRGLFPTDESDSEGFAKFDHHFGSKHTLSLRHAFSRGRVSGDVQALDNSTDVSARGDSRIQDHSFVSGWTAVLSPRAINTVRVQWANRNARFRPNAHGPLYEIPGVISFGAADRLDADRAERHAEIVESFQTAARNHMWSAGASAHWINLDARLRNRFAGVFVFPSVSDFVAGRPDVFVQAFGDPRTHQVTAPIGLWAHDRWQPRAGLTVDMGLRYDTQRMPSLALARPHNIAPRAGIAWQPRRAPAWVLRAGAGLFFDRYPLAFLNEAIQKDGVRAFEQYLVADQAAAAFRLASGGALRTPFEQAGRSIYRFSPSFPSTYGRKLVFGLERRFNADTTVTVEASEVRGLHLPRIRNVQAGLPPEYELEQTATSRYRGVSIALHRRLRNDLTYLVAYHAGKTYDDASDYDEQPMNPRNTRLDWGLSRQHQAHRLAVTVLYEIEEEELHDLPPWLGKALGRIIVSPALTWGTARPVNVLLTTDALRTGAYPMSARPEGIARNSGRTPRTASLDLRIMKTILVRAGRARVQFGVESFNLLNHTNAVRVSPYYVDTFARPTELALPRQVQLMWQIEY